MARAWRRFRIWLPAGTRSLRPLKDSSRESTGSRSRTRFRSGLLIGEIAASFVLLIATALLISSFVQMRNVAPGFDADGVFIAQFNEPAAGQTVFHLHFHVIPRKEGEPLKSHSGVMADGDVLKAHAEKIKAALAS